jgi:quinol monooxygenase YgiN
MKKLMVWITVDSKDGMRDKVIEILDEPFGNTFTANQNGCERLERSLYNQNHNRLFLTELWSSKEDWDTYFENGTKLRDENGFNKRLGELLKEDGIQIIFSDINKLPL